MKYVAPAAEIVKLTAMQEIATGQGGQGGSSEFISGR